jgi:hypothetical protein
MAKAEARVEEELVLLLFAVNQVPGLPSVRDVYSGQELTVCRLTC